MSNEHYKNWMNMSYEHYRELWVNLPKTEAVIPFPLHLDIELTTRCNMKCEMCPFHGSDAVYIRPPRDMKFGLYKRIIEEGVKHGLKSIKLNFGGEPLLYPKIIEAIRYAKYRGILDVQLNTNGLLINSGIIFKIINSGLDLLILSDYNENKQYQNLITLQSLKQLRGIKKPIVRVKTDRPELWLGIADEIEPHNYYDYCNIKNDFMKSDFKCSQPWQRMLVLVDGIVCKCSCGMLHPDKQMNNVKQMSIKDMWESQTMQFLRTCHSQGDSHLVPMCRVCPARNDYISKNLNMKKRNNYT